MIDTLLNAPAAPLDTDVQRQWDAFVRSAMAGTPPTGDDLAAFCAKHGLSRAAFEVEIDLRTLASAVPEDAERLLDILLHMDRRESRSI